MSAISLASYYSVVVLAAFSTLLLPFTPGTACFFLAQSLVWCFATHVLCLQRKRAWLSAGLPHGPPERPDWSEPFPAWAFDAALLNHLIDVPMALVLLAKVLGESGGLTKAVSLTLDQFPLQERYGNTLIVEHTVFSSHFGIFLADLIQLRESPDAMFLAHHVCGMILLASGSLTGRIPGVTALAFCTAVLEVGSMAYCAWVLWRMRKTYVCLQIFSNCTYAVTLVLITIYAERTVFYLLLLTMGVGLVIGRTAVMFSEIKNEQKSQKAA